MAQDPPPSPASEKITGTPAQPQLQYPAVRAGIDPAQHPGQCSQQAADLHCQLALTTHQQYMALHASHHNSSNRAGVLSRLHSQCSMKPHHQGRHSQQTAESNLHWPAHQCVQPMSLSREHYWELKEKMRTARVLDSISACCCTVTQTKMPDHPVQTCVSIRRVVRPRVQDSRLDRDDRLTAPWPSYFWSIIEMEEVN